MVRVVHSRYGISFHLVKTTADSAHLRSSPTPQPVPHTKAPSPEVFLCLLSFWEKMARSSNPMARLSWPLQPNPDRSSGRTNHLRELQPWMRSTEEELPYSTVNGIKYLSTH